MRCFEFKCNVRTRREERVCHVVQAPRPTPFAWGGVDRLPDMLVSYGGQPADVLYYEVLDLPLPEFEKLKSFKVLLQCLTSP